MNRQVAHESRSAAMRSLLHDFNNIMVGLSAISDAALDELPEAHPLQEDINIIKETTQRAQELLRWLSGINTRFPDVIESIDLGPWLPGEVAKLRALLPKGSKVVVEVQEESLQVRLIEEDLRDILFVAAHDVALRTGARVRLLMKASRSKDGILLEINDEPLHPASSLGLEAHTTFSHQERAAFLEAFAEKYRARVQRQSRANGESLQILLPSAKA